RRCALPAWNLRLTRKEPSVAAQPAIGLGVAGLTLNGASYAYPGASRPAVTAIDLDVAAGEFVCLLGPSGCGKSTLLRLMAGLLRPAAGTLSSPSAARGIGWMAQRDGLPPWRRVVDNVGLA